MMGCNAMIPSIRLTQENVILRLMEPGDLPALVEIHRRNAVEAVPDQAEALEGLNEESPNYFVVEAEGRVVGGGGIDLGVNGEQCLLYLAGIDPAVQRRGLGSLLLLARLAWMEGDPGLVWAVVPEGATAFYERFGFERVETPRGRRTAPGCHRLARWVPASEREEIQAKLRALPITDLTGPAGIEEEGEAGREEA